MEAPRGGGGSVARDDRLSVQDARDYFAQPMLRRTILEWRVVVLQGRRGGVEGRAQWREEAIKRLREEHEAESRKIPRGPFGRRGPTPPN